MKTVFEIILRTRVSMKNSDNLLELAKEALKLKFSGHYSSAALLYEQILALQPDWEHGYGHYDLAGCYEDMGDNEKARTAYEQAFRLLPTDTMLLGGLASFLYLHSTPLEAFEKHAQLLKLLQKQRGTAGAVQTMLAIKALGSKLGWSEDEVERRLAVASHEN